MLSQRNSHFVSKGACFLCGTSQLMFQVSMRNKDNSIELARKVAKR